MQLFHVCIRCDCERVFFKPDETYVLGLAANQRYTRQYSRKGDFQLQVHEYTWTQKLAFFKLEFFMGDLDKKHGRVKNTCQLK